jgi:integrase
MIDLARTRTSSCVRIRQQVQRIRGQLLVAPVKTRASQRGLPLLDVVRQALKIQAERQEAYRADMGRAWRDLGLVLTTRTGRPIEPRNLVRSFRRICANNMIRVIKVHHLRHTVGSLLKDLGVPARDVQIILGHARISTTLEIYTDVDEQAKRDALTQLHGLLDQADS